VKIKKKVKITIELNKREAGVLLDILEAAGHLDGVWQVSRCKLVDRLKGAL
jgi:hypothetical protein